MVYIKVRSNSVVQLGGLVATQAMIDDGWEEYNGDVPDCTDGQDYRLIDGVLETYTPEISPLTQVQIYKDYLAATDFKMLSGYVLKDGEDLEAIKAQRDVAREYIRSNDTTKKSLNISPISNTSTTTIG